MIELLVKTENPEALDRVLNSMGAAISQTSTGQYRRESGGFWVRCFGDPDYIEFAITQQGYGEILDRRTITGP